MCGYCVKCTKFGKLFLRKVIKTVATRCLVFSSESPKMRLAAGLRPDPLGDLQRSPRPPSDVGWAKFSSCWDLSLHVILTQWLSQNLLRSFLAVAVLGRGKGGSCPPPKLAACPPPKHSVRPHLKLVLDSEDSLYCTVSALNLVSWPQEIIKTSRRQIIRLKCTKFDVGWSSAPDPAGGAYCAPPDPLAGCKGAYF